MLINIKALNFESEDFVQACEKIRHKVGLANVEDKLDKVERSTADLHRAVCYLSMQMKEREYPMDGLGQHGFLGMRPEDLYFTRETLRAAGINKISEGAYPSPYGYDIYSDREVWATAQGLTRSPNRLIAPMAKKIWETVSEFIDMTSYLPADQTPVGLLRAVQTMYFEAQNVLVSRKREIRNLTDQAITELARTLAETVVLVDKLKYLIRACESSTGAEPGSMEPEFMTGFIEWQIATEQNKAYENAGIREAMSDTYNKLSKAAKTQQEQL